MKDRNNKSIVEKLTYAYIRKIKKWMYCPSCQIGKMSINKKSTVWTCEDCGYQLSADEFEDDYVFWFCDECNSCLNNQEGFNQKAERHICKNCGYENDTTFDNVKGLCGDCGKIISDSGASLCVDCKIIRKQKAREYLITASKVVGVVAAAGAAYFATQASGNEENNSELPLSDEGNNVTRCANCGNTDQNTLWDEGDTLYCSKCCHRTRIDDSKDDLAECPYCHRMRDRKAAYCHWCNDSAWQSSSKEEFEEIDKILKDMGY